MRRAIIVTLVTAGCWTGSPPPPAAPVTPVAKPVAAIGGQGYGGAGDGSDASGFANLIGTDTGTPDPGGYGGLVGVGDPIGVGGGGTGGTIGIGTIGHGSGTGSGYGVGRGGHPSIPTVSIGQPDANGDLDKAIIRRYIKRNLQKITYCYEKELVAQPKLTGKVTARFVIGVDGKVTSSSATGVDPSVADCVASVIKDIEFPAPKGGGIVNVNYPFVFSPAGT